MGKNQILPYQRIWNHISQANNIVIISHRSPDPDSIGSNLSLKQAIQLQNPACKVLSVCIDPVPNNCLFLHQADKFQPNLPDIKPDLFITVDCSNQSQAAFPQNYPKAFQDIDLINIDHHESNDFFGNFHLVDSKLSSTCELLTSMLINLNLNINRQMATCLLMGIYYDTGSFMHTNITDNTFKIAEYLVKKGADHQQIVQKLFRNFTLSKFHLWGKILDSSKLTSKRHLISVISNDELENSPSEDLSGVIDYLCSAKECDLSMLLTEKDNQQLKGSIRTNQNNLNVAKIAKKFGGGGHTKAAGFTINGKVEKQTVWRIKPA